MEAAYDAALREYLKVGSFVSIVKGVTIWLGVAAVAIALLTLAWPETVPICFTPAEQIAPGKMPEPSGL